MDVRRRTPAARRSWFHKNTRPSVMAEKFDPASLLDLMQRDRTACMFMVPTI